MTRWPPWQQPNVIMGIGILLRHHLGACELRLFTEKQAIYKYFTEESRKDCVQFSSLILFIGIKLNYD